MKKILNYSGLMFLALTFTFGACKKKEDPAPSTPTAKTGILKCKIDGTTWESNTASQTVMFGDSIMPGVYAGITADTFYMSGFRVAGTDTSLIVINAVLNANRPGSYTLNTQNQNIVYFKGINAMSIFATILGYNPSGTLTITKFDTVNKKVSGTFTCTMKSKTGGADILVTEGEFTDVTLDITQ